MHLNNACRTGLTAKTAAYTAHRINDCVTAMRNVYRLTGTCDKTGSTGNTLFFFYKSLFSNSSSFCLYSVYRRSCRFTVYFVTETNRYSFLVTQALCSFLTETVQQQTYSSCGHVQDKQRCSAYRIYNGLCLVFSGCFIGIACTGHCAAHCPHCIHD